LRIEKLKKAQRANKMQCKTNNIFKLVIQQNNAILIKIVIETFTKDKYNCSS